MPEWCPRKHNHGACGNDKDNPDNREQTMRTEFHKEIEILKKTQAEMGWNGGEIK